jgi:hypothetical protein
MGNAVGQASPTLRVASLTRAIQFGNSYVYVISNDGLTDRVTCSTLKKTRRFKAESPTGYRTIQFSNPFCAEVIDHVTSCILKKASRLKVESPTGCGTI